MKFDVCLLLDAMTDAQLIEQVRFDDERNDRRRSSRQSEAQLSLVLSHDARHMQRCILSLMMNCPSCDTLQLESSVQYVMNFLGNHFTDA